MNKFWKAVRPLMLLGVVVLLILLLSRLVLLAQYWTRVSQVDALGFVLAQGFRFDIVLVGIVLILPVLIMPLLATTRIAMPWWRLLMTVWVPLVVMAVLLLELTTIPFAQQFDVRPNILFFEYAGHPQEVLSTLWGAYRLPLASGLFFVALIGWQINRVIRRWLVDIQPAVCHMER